MEIGKVFPMVFAWNNLLRQGKDRLGLYLLRRSIFYYATKSVFG